MDTLNAIFEDLSQLFVLLIVWLGVKAVKVFVYLLERGAAWKEIDATS